MKSDCPISDTKLAQFKLSEGGYNRLTKQRKCKKS